MKQSSVLTSVLAFSSLVGGASGCVALQGIESGGDGLTSLDLATLQATLGLEPFDPASPIFPTVANCAGGLETPISMRTLLGKSVRARSVRLYHSFRIGCCRKATSDTTEAAVVKETEAGVVRVAGEGTARAGAVAAVAASLAKKVYKQEIVDRCGMFTVEKEQRRGEGANASGSCSTRPIIRTRTQSPLSVNPRSLSYAPVVFLSSSQVFLYVSLLLCA